MILIKGAAGRIGASCNVTFLQMLNPVTQLSHDYSTAINRQITPSLTWKRALMSRSSWLLLCCRGLVRESRWGTPRRFRSLFENTAAQAPPTDDARTNAARAPTNQRRALWMEKSPALRMCACMEQQLKFTREQNTMTAVSSAHTVQV